MGAMLERLGRWALIASLLVVLAGLALLFAGPKALERWLPHRGIERVDFARLEPDHPRGFLACSPGLCRSEAVDLPVEPLPLAPEEARRRLFALVDSSPGTTLLKIAPDGRQWSFRVSMNDRPVPDVVSVRMLPAGEGRTAIAIYSRAVGWGGGDRARQAARVRRWLAILRP